MKKITEFDHLHTEAEELYREFLKGDCQNYVSGVKKIVSLAPKLKEYQGQCQTHAGKDTIWMSFRPPSLSVGNRVNLMIINPGQM